MPRHCILGCPEGILFSFPKRPLLRRRWLKFLQMKEAAISASSRMCHQHFSPQCFSNLRQVEMGLAKYPSLKEDAVPTLHPDDSQVSEDDISETENELDGMTEAADLSVSHKYETRSANRNRYCSTGVQTFSDYASVGTQTQKMVFNNNITPTKTNPNETKEESLQLFVRGDAEKFVVCRSNLLSLFLACPFCCAKTTAKVQQQVETYIRIQQICESCGRERMWENQDDPHKNVFTSNDGHGVAQSANESQDWCLHGSYPQVEAAAQMDTMVIKVEVEEVGVDSLRTKCDSSLKAERIMKEEGEFNSTADDMEDLLIEVKDEPGNVLEENMNTNLDTRETLVPEELRSAHNSPVSGDGVMAASLSHVCTECGKSFTRKDYLRRHQRLHSSLALYGCNLCAKNFKDAVALRIHSRTHTKETPFQCAQCGKSFTQRCSLKAHLRVHTGESPFSCPSCGRCFNQLSNLRQHCRIHSGERPYTCPDCGKSFLRRRQLDTHQRIHSGETPFTCAACGRSFRSQLCLWKHRRVHTGEATHHSLNLHTSTHESECELTVPSQPDRTKTRNER